MPGLRSLTWNCDAWRIARVHTGLQRRLEQSRQSQWGDRGHSMVNFWKYVAYFHIAVADERR